jgi:lysophospholipase L1-like esterase
VALLATSMLAGCIPPADTYVALGDSYVAGPLIPDQSLQPLGCLRSNKNYPSLARTHVRAAKFVDVSCSGATTTHMAQSQGVTPGPNAPQLNALNNQTKIVTLGIGGNDIGFSGIVKECALQNPFGPGCKPTFVHDGRDELRERIDATGAKVAQVLTAVKARAPRATVFVVGYPTILPDTGTGCYPTVPLLPSDVPYLRDTTKALNAMLRTQALAAGATYIDIYTPSIGHDMCAGSSQRWVEGIIPGTAAAPVHPNAAGMRATAAVVAARINQLVPA